MITLRYLAPGIITGFVVGVIGGISPLALILGYGSLALGIAVLCLLDQQTRKLRR